MRLNPIGKMKMPRGKIKILTYTKPKTDKEVIESVIAKNKGVLDKLSGVSALELLLSKSNDEDDKLEFQIYAAKKRLMI